MRLKATWVVAAASLALLLGPQAAAQSGSDGWQFMVAPYLMGAGLDGSVTLAAFESDVDVPFDQIIDNLDMAFMGHFDMRNERWILSSDIFYVDLGNDKDVAPGTVTAGLKETLFEVAGGLRVTPAFTVLAGARWVDLSTDLRYQGPVVDDRADASASWVDPFVGAHLFVPLAERWQLGVHGDIGGFGVGSELAWQVYADVGWKASDLMTILLGYRAIAMDYEQGSGRDYVNYDLTIAGPQLGAAFTFWAHPGNAGVSARRRGGDDDCPTSNATFLPGPGST